MSLHDGSFKSAKIRARLNYPIIDTDGHTVELMPLYLDYIKKIGGAQMVEDYKSANSKRALNRWTTVGRGGQVLNLDNLPFVPAFNKIF